MSKYRVFTEESRDQILQSLTNQSTSKQAWTFSRQNRFGRIHTNCPQVSYMNETSTLSNRKTSFGKSTRKVFTQTNQGPSSWVYNPKKPENKSNVAVGAGRSEIIANSYIPIDPLKNPGPGKYKEPEQKSRGYSLRPRTANHRNYFIEDQERMLVPGPGNYDDQFSKIVGKNINSKFKSAVLGGTTLLNKSNRFPNYNNKTPSTWAYNTFGGGKRSKGGKIGSQGRPSFTDKAALSSFTPGPGNYRLPTEFGHYRKPFVN